MTQAQIDKHLRETATWWDVSTRNNRGEPAFAAPVTIKCRWEDVQERFVTDAGEERVSRARVFVDRAMPRGSRLYRGDTDETEPEALEGTFLVRQYRQIPDLRNPNVVLREVYL